MRVAKKGEGGGGDIREPCDCHPQDMTVLEVLGIGGSCDGPKATRTLLIALGTLHSRVAKQFGLRTTSSMEHG